MASKFSLKENLVSFFPQLGIAKRYFVALINHYAQTKESYSQHREDVIILQLLEERCKNEKWFYIDIGANHPSTISNTYLLYRLGLYGLTIEPFRELSRLHQVFRPRDIQLAIGCGDKDGLQKFSVSKTPVLSSLKTVQNRNLWKTYFVPIFTLDTIVKSLELDKIHFLSIDVEGMDFEVIKGGSDSLNKVCLICIEANSKVEEDEINNYLVARQFKLIHRLSCNLVYENTNWKNINT